MAKLTKSSAFKEQAAKPETLMDKTTRIVKKIIDDETEQRQVKNTRLRNARLEREAHTPASPKPIARKKQPTKVAPKR
jgi:hypothetical protein